MKPFAPEHSLNVELMKWMKNYCAPNQKITVNSWMGIFLLRKLWNRLEKLFP